MGLLGAVPEVRPWAAVDGGGVARLHGAQAALAHEGDVGVEIEHLDAVVAAGQDAPVELLRPAQGLRARWASVTSWPWVKVPVTAPAASTVGEQTKST